MKYTRMFLFAGTTAATLYSMPSYTQNKNTLSTKDTVDSEKKYSIEEIFVSARKREESLADVPVSISVIDANLINEAGVVTQRNLFQITPGTHYDEGFDRNAALPSIRGVQSNENATNRTKVTAFIDGMPIIGSQGSISFDNVQQIEVYRGPQSAAFGRSTFGGAINYITKTPGGEFEGIVSADVNDFGRKIITASVSGPATETLSYLVEGSWEDSDSPSDYTATDGTQYGARSGKTFFGKLIYYPTGAIETQISYSHVETDDAPTTTYFISEEARNACFDGTTTNGGRDVYGTGILSCDWEQGSQIQAQNDRAALLIANGETDEDRLFLATAQSLSQGDVGGVDERDRLSVKVDYTLDSDHLIQLLGFVGEEDYIRNFDTSFNATDEIAISFNPNSGLWRFDTGRNSTIGGISSDPTEIKETYAEVRFVSPSQERLRYVIGGSYYRYDFLTEVFANGYNAILMGQDAVARYDSLVGNDSRGVSISDPIQLLGEEAVNSSVFFNFSYDINPKAVISVEGRFQSDEVTATDEESGVSGSVKTQTFLPRISFTYDVSSNTSVYAQIAKGNNPAGVNVAFFDPDVAQSIEDSSDFVSYTAETFQFYEEETLINYEIGIKGSAANGRIQYALTGYMMDWEDQIQSVNLSWADPNGGPPGPNTSNQTSINEGDIDLRGIELESTYIVDKHWKLRSTFSYIDATYGDACTSSLVGTGLDSNQDLLETTDTSGRDFDCYNVSGNTVAEQPKLSMSLSPSFDIRFDKSGVNFSARADIFYDGREYLDLANVAEKESVTTANVSMGFNNDNWSAVFYINNITDNNTPLSIIANTDYSLTESVNNEPASQSNYLITPQSPRTFGFRGMIRF